MKFIGHPLNREIKGIRFLHVPKCGGKFLDLVLARMCEEVGLEFINEGHAFHRKIDNGYEPDEHYLTIASVRHPLDLLVSAYRHDDNGNFGFANVARPFKSFKDFFHYFCLMSDFSFASTPEWPLTKEVFHYFVNPGEVRDGFTGRDGRIAGWPIYQQLLLCRPHPWQMRLLGGYPHNLCYGMQSAGFPSDDDAFAYIHRKYGDDWENITAYPALHGYPAGRSNKVFRRLVAPIFSSDTDFEIKTTPYWETYIPCPQVQAQEDSNRELAETLWYECGWTVLDANEFWHFSSNMWCSLFNFEKRTLVPDVIIRLEEIDDMLGALSGLMGVKNHKKYIDEAQLAPHARYKVNARSDGGNFMLNYDDQMLETASRMLHFEHQAFGYRPEENLGLGNSALIINEGAQFNFLPSKESDLSYKWINPDGFPGGPTFNGCNSDEIGENDG